MDRKAEEEPIVGACNAKSEILDPADLGTSLVIEWTADLSQATLSPVGQE
jgi:hypothetical protein